MDKIAAYNRERWNALAGARCEYTRPFLQMNPAEAQAWVDALPTLPRLGMSQLAGKSVLCLASGGGQQTAVFGLLGATVSVLDLSDTQLERDRKAASHHGYPLRTEHGDMRDLSIFADNSFDLVFHPYSINFIPDPRPVFAEVRRVLRPGGIYHLDFANPFWTFEESDWQDGYPLKRPYQDSQMTDTDDAWTFDNEAGEPQKVVGPHEFVITLSTLINGLVAHDFHIRAFAEGPDGGDETAVPGTWEHMIGVVPPFWTIGARYEPAS